MGFPMSHRRRFCAAPNFLKMGIQYLNVSSFWTISTVKDEKSAAKFHYIKNPRSAVLSADASCCILQTTASQAVQLLEVLTVLM